MASGKCGANLTWTLDDNGTLSISGKDEMKDYFYCPPVDKSAPWYVYRDSIKKVTIADDVTSIGDFAFYYCENLTSITISDSVTYIGKYAFSLCKSLVSITVPDSVTFIGEGAFEFCESLTSIRISDGVTFIDGFTFRGCKSLTSVTVPKNVTSIGYFAFDDCSSLEEIHYPAGRGLEENLSSYAKLIPYNLVPPTVSKPKPQPITKPTLPPVKKSTASPAQVNSVPQPVSKPITQPVTEKLRWKVEGKTLTVGGVREIKCYSYDDSPWIDSLNVIQKIVIKDGVEEIAANAFIECTRLEQVTIPASVKTIGDLAFTVCYCGNATNRKNVFWSLDDGTLTIKKNSAERNATDFSIGYETWQVVEENIKRIEVERGVVPSKQFFDWLNHLSSEVPVAF